MKTRKPILVLVILLLLVFMQGQAGAFFRTGNNLVEMMGEYDKSSDSTLSNFKAGGYIGYITGVSDALSGGLWQYSTDVTVRQICAIVAKYLNNHPERWHESAAVLVVDALREAFPLKK